MKRYVLDAVAVAKWRRGEVSIEDYEVPDDNCRHLPPRGFPGNPVIGEPPPEGMEFKVVGPFEALQCGE